MTALLCTGLLLTRQIRRGPSVIAAQRRIIIYIYFDCRKSAVADPILVLETIVTSRKPAYQIHELTTSAHVLLLLNKILARNMVTIRSQCFVERSSANGYYAVQIEGA